MKMTPRLQNLGIIVAAMAIDEGASQADTAPQRALDMWWKIARENCADPDRMTKMEQAYVLRDVLKLSLSLVEKGLARMN